MHKKQVRSYVIHMRVRAPLTGALGAEKLVPNRCTEGPDRLQVWPVGRCTLRCCESAKALTDVQGCGSDLSNL